MKQKSIYILIALLLAVGIFSLGLNYGQKDGSLERFGQIPEQLRTVDVLIDDGNVIRNYKAVDIGRMTVLEALISVTESNKLIFDYDGPEKSAYGAFVKQIGEQKNGDGQKFWQYWVNGAQPLIAADKYELKGGEVILWTFRKSAM